MMIVASPREDTVIFRVVGNNARVPDEGRNIGYLWTDNWDDWFEFSTLYVLTYFDRGGRKHELGGVKFGQFNMDEDQRRPNLPSLFEDERQSLLNALKDCAASPEIYQKAKEERVMGVSLMRSVNERSITGQFRRLINGEARLTRYSFRYQSPAQLDNAFPPLVLDFEVEPYSKPPTNIHVVIGRNGVGKSHLLNSMSRALVSSEVKLESDGAFVDDEEILGDDFSNPFANVVSVTFSAFDEFPLITQPRNATKGTRYTNVGLRKRVRRKSDDGEAEYETVTQQPDDLTSDFIASLKVCITSRERRGRLLNALRTLEADPIFQEANASKLLEFSGDELGRPAGRLFRKLSSGHKIILLTITRLVERVEERSLVIMDEPEAHLHPPLLAAFIRAVSDLLTNRNAVAIVATHSPVVLQEVPRSCAWKLHRHGGGSNIERPLIETFAENVGHLTHETFGLEVTQTGFHKMIGEMVEEADTFQDILEKFNGRLGLEGRALASSLIAQRIDPTDEELD
jgi:predicted ATPase